MMTPLQYWQHQYRLSQAEAMHYRRLCDEYEWALRYIRNAHLSPEQYRYIAAHTLVVAGER